MKVQVNTDGSMEGTEDVAEMVRSTVHAALDRCGDRLTRVETIHRPHGGRHPPLRRRMIEAYGTFNSTGTTVAMKVASNQSRS